MYVGLGIAMLGEALVYPHALRVLLGEIVLALVLSSVFVIALEEPVLRRTFGADYDEYCRNVRRWIPRLTPWYAPPDLD